MIPEITAIAKHDQTAGAVLVSYCATSFPPSDPLRIHGAKRNKSDETTKKINQVKIKMKKMRKGSG